MSNIIKKFIRKLVFLFTYNLYVKPGLNSVSSVRIFGFKFIVPPTVFNPRYTISSKIFAGFIRNMKDLEGKKVLDMGCGTGIVSVVAASKGAVCTAADINPMSVKAASENAMLNGLADKIKAIESDLFSNKLPGAAFDIIFFNPPYYKGTPKNNFEAAFKGGENYEVIHRFFSQAKNFLAPNGYICMIVSSDMDINVLYDIIKTYNYRHEVVTKIMKLFETFYILRLVV